MANKKRWVQAGFVVVLILFVGLICFFRFTNGVHRFQSNEDGAGEAVVVEARKYVPRGELSEERVIKDYSIKIYSDFSEPFISSVVVCKGVEKIFVKEGFRFFFGDTSSADQEMLSSGVDLSGDEVPNLVVTNWTGGAHGYFYVNVLSLGDSFAYLGEIDTAHGGGRGFVEQDQRPGFEYEVLDWSFANWNCCFADSPAPRVILSYRNGEFSPDLELMRKPERSFRELEDCAHRNGLIVEVDAKNLQPQVELWSMMLDLIYSGNMAEAWRFFYYCWPGGNGGRRTAFLKEFVQQLKSGSYWYSIRELNESVLGEQYLEPQIASLLVRD